MLILMRRGILGALSPFAMETVNASIARPMPSSILLIKNEKSVSIKHLLYYGGISHHYDSMPHQWQ
jgi:hypothetical protein